MKHSTIQLFNLSTAAAIAFAIATTAFAELTVTGVTARQRWQWNSLVDVDFTVNGDAGEAYAIDVSATAEGGAKKLRAKTFTTEPIAQSGKKTRIVWDLGADYPDFEADDFQVTVTATPFSDTTPVYLVVDLSDGGSAATWPVRYTTTAPVHTIGVEDPCKTTELWLKRVKAGTITMGGGSSESYPSHTCTLTNDYYLGIFSLTQSQSQNIGYNVKSNLPGFLGAEWGAYFTNASCRATRPCDTLRYPFLRQPYCDPANPDAALTADGIIKRLRDKTELNFDLPTEWQWEYACRAGSTGATYPGAVFRCGGTTPPADYQYNGNKPMWDTAYGTTYVDAYDPNDWGFYGMLGNVYEITLYNKNISIANGDSLTEPKGEKQNSYEIGKGGAWSRTATYCCSYSRNVYNFTSSLSAQAYQWGACICLTIKKTAE